MIKKFKIALTAAFYAGREITEFILTNFPGSVEFIATCDRDSSKYELLIAELAEKHKVRCLRHVNLNSAEWIAELKRNEIDIVMLGWIPTIIKGPGIAAAKVGWINLHPSLLPFGRGKHGYYWAVVEGSPFGVSMHFIDESVDGGRILFQREMPISMTDTGETLYERSLLASLELFKESYPKILAGDFVPAAQKAGAGTYHAGKEIDSHTLIDLNKSYNALELLNILRGRTFSNGPSAGFVKDGKKYYARLSIVEAPD